MMKVISICKDVVYRNPPFDHGSLNLYSHFMTNENSISVCRLTWSIKNKAFNSNRGMACIWETSEYDLNEKFILH